MSFSIKVKNPSSFKGYNVVKTAAIKKEEIKKHDNSSEDQVKNEKDVKIEKQVPKEIHTPIPSGIHTPIPTVIPTKKLDDINFSVPFTALFIGKSGSGKTSLINAFYDKIKDNFEATYLFSPTADADDEYSWVEPENRFEELNCGFIQNLIEYQKKTPKEERAEILLILDDLLGEVTGKMSNNKVLDSLSAKARHFNISLIISSQLATKVSTVIRENSGFIFICYKQRMDALFENTESWKTKRDFVDYCEKHLKDYHSLLLCNAPKTPERAILVLPVDEKYTTGYKPEDDENEIN